MNFIDYKQFKSASEKVRNKIIELWSPEVGDLVGIEKFYIIGENWKETIDYEIKNITKDDIFNYDSKEELLNSFKHESNEVILCLTEGKLIDMIEELTGCIVDMHYEGKGYGYTIELYTNDEKMSEKHSFQYLKCNNRLEAYWKVLNILIEEGDK